MRTLLQLNSEFTKALDKGYDLVKDALATKGIATTEEYDRLPNSHAFKQTSSNTGKGWTKPGQIVGHAFTDFWVICLEFPQLNSAIVYIAGEPAYICEIDDTFEEFIKFQQLPLWNEVENSDLELLWKAPTMTNYIYTFRHLPVCRN
jgi:hypothetical protein